MRWFEPQKIPRDPNSKGLQVIAAGQWRCATSSLQQAFEEILSPPYRPSMHGAYIMPEPALAKLCAITINEPDAATRRANVHSLFHGFNASSDFPGMAYLDDLLELYPNVRIVLNKRSSAAAWVKSVRNTLRFYSTRRYFLATWMWPQSYWHHRVYREYMVWAKRNFGVDDIFSAELYEKHNQWVRDLAAAKGKQVLEWEPADGWEPLCAFLDRPVPDVEFPVSNEAEVIAYLTKILLLRGLAAWLLILSVPGVIVLAYLWRS